MHFRGTKDFTLYSSLFPSGSWNEILSEVLSDLRAMECVAGVGLPMDTFSFGAVVARYVRFVAESYYGSGAGLQYIVIV